jgi:hypothetical protein
MDHVARIKKGMKPGNETVAMNTLKERLEPLKGKFPEILRTELAQATETGNPVQIQQFLEEASQIPARWLAQEYFQW